jgi:hypothetical protein
VHRSQWAVIALVAIPFLLLPKWFLRRDYFRRDNQSPEIELKIDEDGIRTENISHLGSEKQFNWNDFSHYRESSKHYLLYPAKGVLVIPKRIFDPDEIASFDGLLRRKLFSYLPRM